MSEQRFEDILDECIDRMLAGESWQQVIAAYPQHAAELLPALQGAEAASRLQWSAPSASARAAAQRNMLNEVAGTGSAAGNTGNTVKGGVVMGVTQWFRMRPPVARVAAVGAAAVMFGAVTMGAAAATGNAPQPVRSLFGVSDSVIRVEFTGTIVSIDGLTLTVDANGDLRTVVVSDSTRFGDDDDDARSIADFGAGDLVEVEGRLQPDNSVLASRVRFDDDDDDEDRSTPGAATTTPSPAETPAGQPTPVATQDDDDDDDDCDNSGAGSPCDDDDDDRETPFAQPTADDDDDDSDGDNSGPGSGDDGADGDNSGPGSDDDEADDDSSDSGSDDDEAGDDSSGSGSDDDEADDD